MCTAVAPPNTSPRAGSDEFLHSGINMSNEIWRLSHAMEYRQFFAELLPRLDAARQLEREFDRRFAHRFNVLDYLRQDELGLSRIVADLLDPKGTHGQGALFLTAFLDLDGIREALHWPDLSCRRITVVTERQIDHERRIDVSVEIVDAERNAYCLAIENKPYATDQPKQVEDYLSFLKGRYSEKFLLIYLSPHGEGPSEESIPRKSLGKWKDHFAIMAYSTGAAERQDEFKGMRFSAALSDWFRECRRNCEVDRLRWFLKDAEAFCKQTFGGLIMSNDSESTTIRDFVLQDHRNLETAFAVHQSWPGVRDDLCRNFLEHLRGHIETAVRQDRDLKECTQLQDIVVDCKYESAVAYENQIWLFRKSWRPYRAADPSRTRTAITMENASHGPSGWGVGVRSPISRDDMEEDDKKRRDHLVEALHEKFDKVRSFDWWPWWILLDAHKGDWDSRALELDEEYRLGAGGGEQGITRYFVDEFLVVARRAIPIIDKVEGTELHGGA